MARQGTRKAPRITDVPSGQVSPHAEERYRALFEHAPLALWEYDYSASKRKLDAILDSGVGDLKTYLDAHPEVVIELGSGIRPLSVNFEAMRLYGAESEEELLKRDVTELGPAMLQAVKRTILEVAQGKKEATFTTTTLRADGAPMEVLIRWSVMPEGYEDYSRVLVFTLDITESSEAARALEISEARFDAFVENSPLGAHLYELQDDGSLIFVGTNHAADSILGVENEKFVGMTIEEAFPPLAKTPIPAAYCRCAADGVPWEGQEIIYEDGKIAGAYDVHAFPTGKNSMAALFLDVTKRIRQEKELELYRADLERLVVERTAELERTSRDLESITSVVTLMIEARDPYTAGHQNRVATLVRAIGQSLGLDEDTVEDLCTAAHLHDIGKISIPSDILNKPGKLTRAEFNLIKDHPDTAHQILASVNLRPVISMAVHQHHERLNGSGYPFGISGAGVTLGARILAVADVTEAIMSHRPYRPALGVDAAMDEICANREILYDPLVVDACAELFDSGFQFEEAPF